MFIKTQDNPNDFVINFDDIYKWIGFNRKDNAKRLLIKEFTENMHYKILLLAREEQKINQIIDENRGGHNQEKILLTINCFKKFCMKACTKEADKIYDYYIKMESIILKYTQEQFKDQIKLIELKEKLLEENKKSLELKDKLLELKEEEINKMKNKKYEEAEKTGSIYIFTTDKPEFSKCGRAKCSIKRKAQLQTALVDEIKELYSYNTCNDVLLESIIHDIFSGYRSKSNREHFWCNVEYMKTIIDIIGNTYDILKSSYEYISRDELLIKICQNLNITIDHLYKKINNFDELIKLPMQTSIIPQKQLINQPIQTSIIPQKQLTNLQKQKNLKKQTDKLEESIILPTQKKLEKVTIQPKQKN